MNSDVSWSRLADDRGVATTIVLFPIFMAIVFMFAQGMFWQNDRQVCAAAADYASQQVALHGASNAQAEGDALAMMRSAGIRNPSVSISRGEAVTTVVASGTAPGILPGLSVTVSATSATPTEGFQDP